MAIFRIWDYIVLVISEAPTAQQNHPAQPHRVHLPLAKSLGKRH